MSRDNYYRHRSRERSRSFSAYRHKQQYHRASPPPQPKHNRNRSISPRAEDKFRYSRSPERNGGSGRNGHGNHSSPPRSRAPEPSKVIGVFGLHVRTPEDEIRDIFERFGPIDKITMIHDVKTRSFRGYCFIYYSSLRDATSAMQATNGIEIREKRIRVDFSYTQRAHTPTPGFYRGHRGRNRSFERQAQPPRRHRSRSRDDRSQRDTFRNRSRDRERERRRSPEKSRYRSPIMRERRRERDRS